jgi:hypothetical protein
MDEWFETAARIVAQDRPLDELVTTTRTWQTGLVRFLYARREVLAGLRREGLTPENAATLEKRLKAIDVYAPGRLVNRRGIYEGTGLWWTTMAPHALKMPVRGGAHHLLGRHLCSEFHAINVDAAAVLQAVGTQTENLRTLSSIAASPMRTQKGCMGCHAPMDGAAGFLGEMQGAMYGSHPTGLPGEGDFFIGGAKDFRGKGEGMSALANFVVTAPEFETCSVRRAFEEVLQRPLKSRDQDLFESLVRRFDENGHRWKPILAAIFKSATYRAGAATPEPVVAHTKAPEQVPESIVNVLYDSCVRCHNERHEVLDLRVPPPVTAVATWKAILREVSDYSMPPPKLEGAVINRFPLDPSVRRTLTRDEEGRRSRHRHPGTRRRWRSRPAPVGRSVIAGCAGRAARRHPREAAGARLAGSLRRGRPARQ